MASLNRIHPRPGRVGSDTWTCAPSTRRRTGPPYEQLRVQIASRVASGELLEGTRLPTVRALAAELRLAANTVARAYKELESDGVVVTEGRRGTFVAPSVAGRSEDAAARRR